MRIAAVQLNSGENKQKNIKKVLMLIDKAAEMGADFVLLPEYVNYLGEDTERVKFAESVPGDTSNAFSEKAKKHNIYLNCGSLLEKADSNLVYNTSLLFNPDGEIIAKYRKIHLYDADFADRHVIKESDTVKAGKKVVVADTSFGKVGLTICYDLRFPELYRSLALQGSKIIFAPAAFPIYTGAHHWEVLLRARAIENQCFVIAAGQIGSTKTGIVNFGNSMIIDPWGTILSRASEEEGIIIEDINLDYMDKIRSKLPCLKHRQSQIYKL